VDNHSIIMKVHASILASIIFLSGSDAFSVSPINVERRTAPRCAPLGAKVSNSFIADVAKGAGILSVSLAIISGTANTVNAVEMLPERQQFISVESSTVTLSLGEFADFSMPSYKDATAAAPMTDLKGGRMAQTSFDGSTESASKEEKPLDAAEQAKMAEEKKNATAAKKIAQKAAREKQLADAEAAAKK